MTVAVIFVVLGFVHGLLITGTLALLRGRRVVGLDGQVRRRRGAGRMLLGVIGVGLVVALLAVEAGWFYAERRFAEIERVDVDADLDGDGRAESVLAGGASRGANFLLVGTDNRPGFPQNLADTILILRTGDGPARMMSVPRDLLVDIPTRGEQGRINSAYNDGPVGLIRAVQESVGIPIDRYIEINFVSFAGLIDAIGGVTINFPNPAIDTRSGLNVPEAGDVTLDGEQALAYVRSRAYQEVIDGEVQPTDGLADLSRIQRQQTFLRAVLSEAGASRNPLTLNRIGESLLDGLKVDNHMELIDALRFAWTMGRLDPQTTELPVMFIPGSGAVALQQPEASAVIADFSS